VAELTELPLAQARRLLGAAGGSVKVALAMHFTGLGRAAVQERLQYASLRALEQEKSRSRGAR
jgi:N-acetylmuramic acid 6-phosphate etherase